MRILSILLLVICSSYATSALAQSWGYLGVNGGGQFTSVFFSDTFRPVNMKTGNIYGKHFGVVGKFFMAEHGGIQAEVNYVEKGYDQAFLQSTGYYSTKMSYLEIPLMMNAYLGKKKTQFFINAGPYVQFFISQKQTLIGTPDAAEEYYPFDPKKDHTKGVGLRASGGINRLFGFGQLQLEGGMEMSVTDMLYSNRLVSDVPDGSKQYMGFVSLAYMIPIGKKPEPTKKK